MPAVVTLMNLGTVPPLTPTLSRREREFALKHFKTTDLNNDKTVSLSRRERAGVRG